MSDNYYQLLGLEQDYVIDEQKLKQHYHQLIAKVHPDNFVNESNTQKRLAMQQSSLLNDAYQTLLDPLKRAIYHLSLFDQALDQQQSVNDPMLLMEQMEMREKMEHILSQSDAFNLLQQQKQMLQQQLDEQQRQLAQLFSQGASKLEQSKSALLRFQFLYKLFMDYQQAEEKLLF